MKLKNNNLINVELDFGTSKHKLGKLAIKDHKVWFEYDQGFLKTNLEISPFKLPQQAGLIPAEDSMPSGLFGVFNDSLPDAWGMLLLDRSLRKHQIQAETLNILDKLLFINSTSLGALRYHPEQNIQSENKTINLAKLSQESHKIIEGQSSETLEELFTLNASFGGARPKIQAQVSKDKKHISASREGNNENWIIKFPATSDIQNISLIEYAYSILAAQAGIEMPETHLFESQNQRFFGVKRFDNNNDKIFHCHSASGLLHADHRYPSLDYDNLLKLCLNLTNDFEEVLKVYKLMVFNCLAHNRDDHSKNFSFLMNSEGEWTFAPAYDLTFSFGPGGEHSMLINGNGKNPDIDDLLALASKHGIKKNEALEIIEKVRSSLNGWACLAQDIGISKQSSQEISKYFSLV